MGIRLEVQVLQRSFVEAQVRSDALERGNRENQSENIRLHEEIHRLQTRRRTRKRN
jgi:hypothetical protein